jgi:hypothetical protein
MNDRVTSEDLIRYFRNYSTITNKIFVESDVDINIGNNIAAYFNNQNLSIDFCKSCIEFYIDSKKGVGVSLSDFVMQLSDIRDTVSAITEDKKNIDMIMKRTREIMKRMEASD